MSEDFLDQTARVLLANNEREERKLEKELRKLQNKLSGVPAAAKALGNTASREIAQVKKHVMSAATRAKISKATKARWAKFRAQASRKALNSSPNLPREKLASLIRLAIFNANVYGNDPRVLQILGT